MAGITTSGVGSGIDIKSLVQQLVAAEGAPVTQRLDKQEAKYQAQLSAIGSFKGALSSFQSSLSSLTTLATFRRSTATSSDSTVVTATAGENAVSGSYQIVSVQMAKAQTLRTGAFSSSTATVGTGTLTFQFGDPTKAAQTVTIGSGNNSLEGIRDAVNAARIGVQASVVNGDSGYQLVFASSNTGTDNSLKISVSESPADGTNTDMNGLSQLAYDPDGVVGSGKNMTQVVAAQDAIASINGIQVTSATNTISDAIDGLSFTLVKESPATTATISVAQDKSSVTAAVQAFVKAYNSLVGSVSTIAGYNSATKTGGVLIGDSLVRGIMNQVRQVLTGTVGSSGSYNALIDIGIKTQADGTVALDAAKLSTALDNGFEEVARVFSAAATSTDSLVSYSSSTDKTRAGSYGLNVSRLATQGTYIDTASSISSLTPVVDATNDTFMVSVNGTQSGSISLTQKTYASRQDLAEELQSRINGDSLLRAAGATVTVGYDAVNNRFTFTSDRYGSSSSVQITSVEETVASGTIGLTVNADADTAGLDVSGELGGVTGSGAGQYLTGGTGSAVEGLKLRIEGSATGDRGTVVFTRGIADRLNTLLGQLLGSNSPLDSRTSSINKSIEDISDRREQLSMRLDALTKRYTAQFTAMDTLVSQLNSTSAYLSQQLTSLARLTSSSE